MRKTVTTAAGPIAYLEAGEGKVALFIHGVFLNADLWRPTIELVQAGRRCIAVDLPAHGATPAVADMSLPGLADLLEDFCDALGLVEIDVVANDTGGALAQVFAVRHPARFRTLTLTNCDASDNLPPEQFKPVVELAQQGELAPAAMQMLVDFDFARSDAGLGAGFERPLNDNTIRMFLEPCVGTIEAARDLERFIVSLSAADLVASEDGLRSLQVPTLIVWGTGDVFFDRSWAAWLHDTIAGSTEVVELDGAKLFFPYERPAELVGPLERHWASVASAR
ncbi:MAG: alpha/beta fold hydrolase [Acidimicrobiales bacterium]